MKTKNSIHVLSRAVIIDEEHILLCKTVNSPMIFYFLPGGHINHNESVRAALLRELVEETGFECKIQRFLGCLEYSFVPEHKDICHNHEYNFIFEVESTLLKRGSIIPQLEDHIQLVWVPLNKINDIDLRAEPLKKLIPDWLKLSMNNAFQSEMLKHN